MKFPIAIEKEAEAAFSVVIPDLPGCFSAGDTLDEAIENAKEAAELWLETVIDDGENIPEPSLISVHQSAPEFAGWIWAVIDVDIASLSDKTERVNLTLPSRVLRRIDRDAKAAGESRSGFIARKMLAACAS